MRVPLAMPEPVQHAAALPVFTQAILVADAYFLKSFALTKSLSTITIDFSPFNVEAGTLRKWSVLPPTCTCASLLTATFLKSVFMASLDTEKPAPCTAAFIASKFIADPGLKLTLNDELLI